MKAPLEEGLFGFSGNYYIIYDMNEALSAKLKTLPSSPGVYFHKNADGEIIYVGKAAVLKNRVRQYFQHSEKDTKTAALVREIAMTYQNGTSYCATIKLSLMFELI